jgi:hypothetical protein
MGSNGVLLQVVGATTLRTRNRLGAGRAGDRDSGRRRGRAAVLVAILAALALAGPLADSSQAFSLADTVTLQLSPSLIPAVGGSTTATATVTGRACP